MLNYCCVTLHSTAIMIHRQQLLLPQVGCAADSLLLVSVVVGTFQKYDRDGRNRR